MLPEPVENPALIHLAKILETPCLHHVLGSGSGQSSFFRLQNLNPCPLNAHDSSPNDDELSTHCVCTVHADSILACPVSKLNSFESMSSARLANIPRRVCLCKRTTPRLMELDYLVHIRREVVIATFTCHSSSFSLQRTAKINME